MIYKQRIILASVFILILISELFPPWVYVDKNSSIEISAGFHFAFSADIESKVSAKVKELIKLSYDYPASDVFIRKDVGLLNLQRLSLLLYMCGFSMIFDEKKSVRKKIFAISFLLIAVGFTGLWFFDLLLNKGLPI